MTMIPPPKDTHHQNQSEKNRKESKNRERKRSANIVRAFFARERTRKSLSPRGRKREIIAKKPGATALFRDSHYFIGEF
jgi:hypothetical protein